MSAELASGREVAWRCPGVRTREAARVFGRKSITPVEECMHADHPDAVHWHYGYGNRHWSYDGPVRDDFSNDTTQFAKGAELESASGAN